MIKQIRPAYIDTPRNAEYYGKSTDNKSAITPLKNGDIFYEMDTVKVFMYDEETQTWIEQ